MTTNMFIAGKGWLYTLDSRAKLIGLLLFCIQVFLPMRQIGVWFLVLLSIAVAIRSVGWAQAFSPLRMVFPVLLVMLMFVPFTYRDGDSMFIIGSLTIATRESILQFSKFASRFIAITYLCILFFWTTTMATILATLRWFGLPYRQSLVITLAFRFVPFIAEAFKMISDSHAMRESTYGQKVHKRNRIKDIMPTVTAALVFSLKSIPNLAMSLEHRGFGRSNVRTTFRSLETNRSLFTHCALSVIICVLFWILFHS